MILTDPRLLLLLLLLPGGIRPGAPSTADRSAHLRSSEPPPGTRLPTDGTPPDLETPTGPHRTDRTGFPSKPHRTETPTEPRRSNANLPPEPNWIGRGFTLEPQRTEPNSPSEPKRTKTQYTTKSNITESHSTEPNRTPSQTELPSEPKRTETENPSEPNITETYSPSEPNRTETVSPSEPDRSETENPSELNRTETYSPSEPNSNQSKTEFPSVPNRTEFDSASDTSSEPNRTETDSPSQPNRTEHDSESEANRTGTDYPSEPNRTETHSPFVGHEDEDSFFVTEHKKAQTVAEPDWNGRQNFFRLDNSRTEPDFTQTDGQTSSAFGLTQKSVTRRHISKRTPHMDTTSMSTTFTDGSDGPLRSLTNNTKVSDISGNPTTSTTGLDSDPTNTGTKLNEFVTEDSRNKTSHSGAMTQISVTSANDSGNTTQSFVTITQDSQRSTEISGINKTDFELSASITYPLQTPSYLMTTYPSPTSDQVSESSAPFTSIPVNASNTTRDIQGTDPSISQSISASSTPLSTFPASSSSLPSSHQSDVSSSSPIPSTLVSLSFSTSSNFQYEASPKFTSTKPSAPWTTLLTTPDLPSLSSLPSVRPSLHTTASDDGGGTSFSTSLPSARTDQTSGTHNSSTAGPKESYTTETGERFLDRTTTALKDMGTTLRSILETQTSVIPLEDRITQSITTTQMTKPPAQPTNLIPLTTSRNFPIPSPHMSTQGSPGDIPVTTRQGGPVLTTGDPSKHVTTIRTTSVDMKTVKPQLETTVSNRKMAALTTTTPPGAITTKYSTTVPTSSPTPAMSSRPTLPTPVSICSPNPCHNGGSCVQHHKGYRCQCPPAWQGHQCDTDVDECLSKPCPAQSTCVNLQGSFTCRCPLGYILEKGTSCVQVRTFLGHIEIPKSFLNASHGKYTKLQQIEEAIVQMLNSSFSVIGGYYQSTITNSSFSNRIELSVQNVFLLSSNVTLYDLRHHIQRYKKGCQTSPQHSPACQLILHSELYYIAISLCNVKNPGCDNETSECTDPAGVAQCQCKPGYFKYSTTDRSCRACDDGYKLQDGVCVRCPFGLGGFNCSNPYQLITVIISAAGGGLLLILGIALAVTCCRKNKHDISKLIFKSGDFQMSPYAEYPKTQRSSDWGRETIEMQENGSTKNLLQMTDVYYSPGLRNSEMERNGLYPYTGLPGSRHSCIYPGQYNPTFINEENRRRDYF